MHGDCFVEVDDPSAGIHLGVLRVNVDSVLTIPSHSEPVSLGSEPCRSRSIRMFVPKLCSANRTLMSPLVLTGLMSEPL